MPHITTDDDVKLYYEETGSGLPVVFVHEFAGDYRSYETQMRYFGRRYRCIAYNARGYPPSDVPKDPARYSQDRARDDIRAVLDALKIEQAHIVGLSMGGFATLHFGFTYPARVRSLAAAQFESQTMAKAAEAYALGPTRVQFQNKDRRGWTEFAKQLAEHSTEGSALTMRGVQARRPSLFDLVEKMKTIAAPTLIMTGDEDWPCLEPAVLMKRTIPTAALVVMPNAGHAINLEDPAAFNAHIADFFHSVDVGAWRKRDPRAMGSAILGR
jgi:pimeloyl-ACP methyl ester carboxylesterase